jgi:hypothetical protein
MPSLDDIYSGRFKVKDGRLSDFGVNVSLDDMLMTLLRNNAKLTANQAQVQRAQQDSPEFAQLMAKAAALAQQKMGTENAEGTDLYNQLAMPMQSLGMAPYLPPQQKPKSK